MKTLIGKITTLSLIVIGCTSKPTIKVPELSETSSYEVPSHTIPIETALDNLDQFLKQTNPDTKSISYNAGDIISINSNRIKTRSSSMDEPLLYIVNFEDDNGYAILSADDRIPDDIIAITSDGRISITDFEPYDSFIPGDDDDILEEQYNEMSAAGYIGSESGNREIANLCLGYGECIAELGNSNDSSIPDDDDFSSDEGSSEKYQWEIEKAVDFKVSTIWKQHSPFNDLCPYVGIKKQEQAPIGCVPLAVGQIVAYHRFPDITWNNVHIDFTELLTIQNLNHSGDTISNEAALMAKHFMNMLASGIGCDVVYGKFCNRAFGFALPGGARKCFEALGYKNVELNWGYDESKVIETIDNDCPVFMSAIDGLIDGHAWVIDGYKKRKHVSSSGHVDKRQYLVHCNWGWGGCNNGYFSSGIFKTLSAVEFDHAFNTVTYEKF